MEKKIKLIALDLDGTLLDDEKHLSERNRQAVKDAVKSGVHMIVSTGRPLSGIPVEDMRDMGMEYAISTNGAAIYKVTEDEIQTIYKDGMDSQLAYELMTEMSDLDIHMDAVIDGQGYCAVKARDRIKDLMIMESMKEYIHMSRTFIEDLPGFLQKSDSVVQKMTLYFYSDGKGDCKDYGETLRRLMEHKEISVATGGYHNLEITKAGATKGKALLWLADRLGVDIEETLACGDTENDIDILKTAGVGVAMENATDDVKEIADFITLSNEEDGVAHAIAYYLK